jgi:hypothetical protein
MTRQPHKMIVLRQTPFEHPTEGEMTRTEVTCSCKKHRSTIVRVTYAEGYRAAQQNHGAHVAAVGGDDNWGVVEAMRKVKA